MKPTVTALSFGGAATLLAGGIENDQFDLSYGIAAIILMLFISALFSYLAYRRDKPIYHGGQAHYRFGYYLARGYTDDQIADYIDERNFYLIYKGYIYIGEYDFALFVSQVEGNE